MQHFTSLPILIASLTIFASHITALPSNIQEESRVVPSSLERRTAEDDYAGHFICKDKPLPTGPWPEGINPTSFKNWGELCFSQSNPGNVGCACVNFETRAYCSPFLGLSTLRPFGRECEETCRCIAPYVEDFSFAEDDDDISVGLKKGQSSSSKGFESLLSFSSTASLTGYEADSVPAIEYRQCSASPCEGMSDCGGECVCGVAVTKYVSIDPLFSPSMWSCITPFAKHALAAVGASTVLQHTRPRKHHHRPILGGRDLSGLSSEGVDPEDEEKRDLEYREDDGEMDSESQETELIWACPCNTTFAHGDCCETRAGEVWDVPNLLTLDI